MTGKGLVREAGLEPARAEAHKILSLARLPIPPLPRISPRGFVASTSRQVKDLLAHGRQRSAGGFLPDGHGDRIWRRAMG